MGDEPEVAFWAVKIAKGAPPPLRSRRHWRPLAARAAHPPPAPPRAGESSAVVADFDDDQYETLHLTQVALGEAPAKGPHTVFVEQDGAPRVGERDRERNSPVAPPPRQRRRRRPAVAATSPPAPPTLARAGLKFAIGTLNRDSCCHFPIDITIATDSVSISHSGGSEVYVTGYRTLHVRGLRMESDEDDDGLGRLMYGSGDSDESGESGSEGESDSEGESGSEEEESSEEDDDEAPRAVPLGNGVYRHASARGMLDAEAGSGSESEELGSEGDEEGSEESSDEDEDAGASSEDGESEEEAPAPAPAPAKRKAPAAAAKTPQPAKRAKPDAPRAPASAPARVGAAAAAAAAPAPADAKAYEAALKAHIAAHGPATLAALGSAVKRPPAVPKLKGFLVQRAGVFKYDQAADTVSLA
jgi:hypothetical protein